MSRLILFGGSGFIGSYLVKHLAAGGHQIKVFARNVQKANALKVCGNPGQIMVIGGDVLNKPCLEAHIKGMDVVINLVGTIFEHGIYKFNALHIAAAKNIAHQSNRLGVKQLIHFSALIPGGKSRYENSKNMGEIKVRQEFPKSVILRPGLVFGLGDSFFSKFARMMDFSPCLPLIGGGKNLFQPVYAGDIAKLVSLIVEEKIHTESYNIVGPDTYSFRELMQFIFLVTGKKRYLLSLPFWISKFLGWLLESNLLLVATKMITGKFNPIMTKDQVELMRSDYTSEDEVFTRFGISPKKIDAIVPEYLHSE